jgi:hypothetical protein
VATSLQYEFFKQLYLEQNERRKALEGRAQFYFSILSFYFGLVIFKFSDLLNPAKVLSPAAVSPGLKAIQVVVASFLVAVLASTLLATRIKRYEMPANPKAIIVNFGASPPSDEEFCDHRIVDFGVATTRNWETNERSALFLRVSGWFLVAAVFSHFGSFFIQ